MLERRSALPVLDAGTQLAEPVLGTHRRAELVIGEVTGWSLTQIAGFAGTIGTVEQRLGELLGALPPATAAAPVTAGNSTVFRSGHRQFWVVDPETSTFAARARSAIAADVGAVTPLSHARTRLLIAGAPAARVLAKGIALDLSTGSFPAGAAALTGLHHTPVLLHHAEPGRYELYAMRTYTHSVLEWLRDAAAEFGYTLEQVRHPSPG